MIAASRQKNDKTGLCKCNVGFADEDCSRKLRCPNANETFMCNGRGECHEDLKGEASGIYDGVCKCKEPFSGKSCELQPCKASEDGKECYGRGTCDKSTGLCACEQGMSQAASCGDKKCNGNGRCFARPYRAGELQTRFQGVHADPNWRLKQWKWALAMEMEIA